MHPCDKLGMGHEELQLQVKGTFGICGEDFELVVKRYISFISDFMVPKTKGLDLDHVHTTFDSIVNRGLPSANVPMSFSTTLMPSSKHMCIDLAA